MNISNSKNGGLDRLLIFRPKNCVSTCYSSENSVGYLYTLPADAPTQYYGRKVAIGTYNNTVRSAGSRLALGRLSQVAGMRTIK